MRFNDLELISGCCIYLSSKLVDLNPIYIDDLINEVKLKLILGFRM